MENNGNGNGSRNLPASIDHEADRMLQETASANSRLTYKKGNFFIEDSEIELGHKYIAFPREWTRGWMKWQDGRPIAEKLGKASEYDPPPREEIGDLDKSKWEDENKDPWSMQNILPLVDMETNDFVLFCSSSWGGLKAIRKLVNQYYREIKTGRHLGNPIIAIGSYDRPTEHGLTPTPKFDILEWEDPEAPLPPIQEVMGGDSIPY
jgi:hypothetical protein